MIQTNRNEEEFRFNYKLMLFTKLIMNISTQHYLEVVLLCAELLSSNKC
jgi:hypothetical protein